MKKEIVKISMNMSAEMAGRVDEYAYSLDLSRTSAIKLLVNQALDYKDAVGMIGTLPDIIARAESLKEEKLAEK